MSGSLDLIWRRFREVKSSHPEAILLLHISDFYQALYEDAFPIARLTGYPVQRLHGKSRLLYCGFPCKELEEMLSKLRMFGYCVVVREQPPGFARYLRSNRRRLKAEADRTPRIVQQALTHVSEPGFVENGLEHEYERENSRRWRAWYDLTRGRLLATSVRLEEYRLACDLVVEPGFLDETTNHLLFVPALEMKSHPSFQRRAEEAERLLMRCVRENPRTPWAWLAQRELDYGLGIDARQDTLTRVMMPPSRTRQYRLPKL